MGRVNYWVGSWCLAMGIVLASRDDSGVKAWVAETLPVEVLRVEESEAVRRSDLFFHCDPSFEGIY